ncbi:hypothetical protein HMPREF9078_01216 [Capnocytophaga sp. oral taxon 380 str. F0488]|nr:hypothetical protein HMPREF9078_01216 [Capnocytophaga sp. oral taxon 380 str. F0488]
MNRGGGLSFFSSLHFLFLCSIFLQGVALILFKFCLISEAQPHSPNTTSHPIYQFPHSLIFSFPHSLIPSFSNFLIFSFSAHRFCVAIPSAYCLWPKASHLKT